MQKQGRFSLKERKILLWYATGFVVVLFLFILLSVIREGLPVPGAKSGHVELAVLVPLSGSQSEQGHTALQSVQQAAKNVPPGLKLNELEVTVVGYDTQSTPEGAASAAWSAARNPSTVAIVGPFDARQLVAAAEVLKGKDIAIISPASTAPTLPLKQYPGVYCIPADDNAQGRAIADFLQRGLNRTNVYLIAESTTYAEAIKETFTQTLQSRVHVVDTLQLGQGAWPSDLAQNITRSEADVIVFLGGSKNARSLLEALKTADLKLPIVGSDSLNDPALLPLPENSPILYYTSPIVSLTAMPEDATFSIFKQALGNHTKSPFAYETTQAVWLVLGALSRPSSSDVERDVVWHKLASISLTSGPRFSRSIYVYQVDPNGQDWSLNNLIYIHQD